MTQKTKSVKQRNMIIVGGVIVAAVVVALVVILLSSQSAIGELTSDYSAIPQGRQDDGGFVLGSPDAPITVVAFEDFLCGHCQRYKETVDKLIEQYVAKGLARFEYRMLPVVHAGYSRLSAQLAECADDLKPGSFWNAHDALFQIASARSFSDSASRTFAEMMNLPYTDLLECTQDASQVDIDIMLANQLNVTGTPTVFIRYGNSFPQTSQFGPRPTFEQLGLLVQTAG